MTGLVYYVLDATRLEQRMKIGYTTSLMARLQALRLQTVTRQEPLVLALEPGDLDLECVRHRQFSSLRLDGEWFRYEGALREWVSDLSQPLSLLLDRPHLWRYAQRFGTVPHLPPTLLDTEPDEPMVDLSEVEF